MQIGRLESVPLRTLWSSEARDFTAWLAENLEFLSQALGTDLSLLEQEGAAGAFSVDLVAEDASGQQVVIENQLERTDHDHLGKLITYLSNLDAKMAVWITSDPRPEHEQAVHWLNEVVPADTAFYLVKVEAYRIGDSPPAPQLIVVAGPSPEAREVGEQKKELAERHVSRLAFWKQLLERAKQKTSLHARISPSKENWLSTGAGKSGVSYNYVIRMADARIELYIDCGNATENKRIFDALASQKDEIERRFGDELEWHRLDNLQTSRIARMIPGGGLRDEDRWPEIHDRMIDAMARFEQAMRPHIKRL
jgi:hypothetical protein